MFRKLLDALLDILLGKHRRKVTVTKLSPVFDTWNIQAEGDANSRAVLESLAQFCDSEQYVQFSPSSRSRLVGAIHGHKKIPEGVKIRTSTIQYIERVNRPQLSQKQINRLPPEDFQTLVKQQDIDLCAVTHRGHRYYFSSSALQTA